MFYITVFAPAVRWKMRMRSSETAACPPPWPPRGAMRCILSDSLEEGEGEQGNGDERVRREGVTSHLFRLTESGGILLEWNKGGGGEGSFDRHRCALVC